jgi:hypothetical protein
LRDPTHNLRQKRFIARATLARMRLAVSGTEFKALVNDVGDALPAFGVHASKLRNIL